MDFHDEEPAWRWISGIVRWGQNVIDGVLDESLLDGYDVWLVDACGEHRTHLGRVSKQTWPDQTGCCAADAYNLTLSIMLIPEELCCVLPW